MKKKYKAFICIIAILLVSFLGFYNFSQNNKPLSPVKKTLPSNINKNYKKDNNKTISNRQPLTVQEALRKHNMNLTVSDAFESFYILWSYNKGKTSFLLLITIAFIVYMQIHTRAVFILGLLISIIIGSSIGIYNTYYNKTNPTESFYKKIEKRTGEKIIRNFDFF